MFKWYQSAQVCYAYLSDVTSAVDDPSTPDSEFRRSQWFTRGWTLQELLAPHHVEFYDRDWVEIGTKSSLEPVVKEITGIRWLFDYHKACIAQKMSWAANRHTTREEDIAYCLMGLFGVNMPTLYGEGDKAFLRLQQEILSKNSDESIFAWETPPEDDDYVFSGLLANSPTWFNKCGNFAEMYFDPDRPPHTMTNRGLRLELLIETVEKGSARVEETTNAPLNCAELVRTKQGTAMSSWMVACLAIRSTFEAGDHVRLCYRQRNLVFKNLPVGDHKGFTRETIFFRQVEPLSIRISEQTPKILLVNARALYNLGFQRNGKLDDDQRFWEMEDSDEPCLRLHSYSHTAALEFSHGTKYGKLFLFVDASQDSILDTMLRFEAWVVAEGTLMGDDMNLIFSKWRSNLWRSDSSDRISRQLGDGTSLSFALKKTVRSGEPAFVIDITVDPEGKPRWPAT
ncbi:hypothetical protein EG329_008087 [Mollisiaceae sp. DMI_Dod_QoI]|nr:hypothetical protein EG329_008087 [Helotiales sp. DMI_Dod_QoI]